MTNIEERVWIWSQNKEIFKAVFCRRRLSFSREVEIFTLYDEEDEIIARRIGISKKEIDEFEASFQEYCTRDNYKVSHLHD